MSTLETLESGSRHDLRVGKSPDAPDESLFKDDAEGAFGYCHSYETSSRYDGPGVRVVLFTSGCLLRCVYCHNPDTWHLKDGTYVSAQQVLDRLSGFASAIKSLGGGLTISGGEPMNVFWALITTIGRSGRAFLIRGMRSNAFSSGITTSVITRSPSPCVIQRHSVAAFPVERTS